jgi:hypothetical protein
LFKLPRVETYRGLIFASFKLDVFDRRMNLSTSGEIVSIKPARTIPIAGTLSQL